MAAFSSLVQVVTFVVFFTLYKALVSSLTYFLTFLIFFSSLSSQVFRYFATISSSDFNSSSHLALQAGRISVSTFLRQSSSQMIFRLASSRSRDKESSSRSRRSFASISQVRVVLKSSSHLALYSLMILWRSSSSHCFFLLSSFSSSALISFLKVARISCSHIAFLSVTTYSYSSYLMSGVS